MHAREAAAKERSEREGTGAYACPEQGVLPPEDHAALGTGRHEAVKAGHPAPRHELHRSPQGHLNRRNGRGGPHTPSQLGESRASTFPCYARNISIQTFRHYTLDLYYSI